MTEQEINQCVHELYGVMAATGEIDNQRGLRICHEMKCIIKAKPVKNPDPMAERFVKAVIQWGVPPDDLHSVISRISTRILADGFNGTMQ